MTEISQEAVDAAWLAFAADSGTMEDALEAASPHRQKAIQAQVLAEVREVLVEAAIPLEVIAGQHRVNPYKELSPDLLNEINSAIQQIRKLLATLNPSYTPEDFELLRALGLALGAAWQSETIGTDIARQNAIKALEELEARIGIENMPAAALYAMADLKGGRE